MATALLKKLNYLYLRGRKMFKRSRIITSFAIASVLAASLVAGCGSKGDKDIKIRMVYELTGNTASYGTSAANGA